MQAFDPILHMPTPKDRLRYQEIRNAGKGRRLREQAAASNRAMWKQQRCVARRSQSHRFCAWHVAENIAISHGHVAAMVASVGPSLECGASSAAMRQPLTAQWRRQLERETNLAVDVEHEVHLIVLASCHQTIHCAQQAPEHCIADAEHGAQRVASEQPASVAGTALALQCPH